MNIFVLNRGSSSIKCELYHFNSAPTHAVPALWEGRVEWKNDFEKPLLTCKNAQGVQHSETISARHAAQALDQLLHFLIQGKTAVLHSLNEVDVIGHRIVHGGRKFTESVRITAAVKDAIRHLSELAPLHNLSELEGIEILEKRFPDKRQVAVFDTAFHHTLSDAAKIYPGPYRWYEQGIQRYGFHGISFDYCTQRAAEMLQTDLKHLKIVICHLGAGASLCAIKDGKSIDTTMGFTPLDGLMMDTRSGSVDPGILLHLLQKQNKSAAQISKELNEESGLLGISGVSSDMREIIALSEKENARATLALEMYVHRLCGLIASMTAALRGMDVLVFTAGIGEHAAILREKVCDVFAFLNVKLDRARNANPTHEDALLSAADSAIRVLLIHTREAFQIAKECWKNCERN